MRNIRIFIFMIVVTLVCSGIIFVYSSSAIFAYEKYGSASFFLRHHLLHLLIGAALAAYLMSLDLRRLRRWSRPLFTFALLLLILVFVPHLGKEVSGARRWLNLGMFNFQPSELVKWAAILFLADALAKAKDKKINFARSLLGPVLAVGGACALILSQPDLGGTMTLVSISLLLFFVSGMHLRVIIGLGLISLPALYFAVFCVPYRWRRILVFLNPWADPRGYGFQMVQSYLALGLGGFWGAGLGQSRQKLFYLPCAHTDFIFSIIGEEMGLIGTAAIAILFALFLWQGIKISLRSADTFIKLLSFGIVCAITLPALVHMAVACGAVPTKGLPLPFISYGGSALVFNMMAVGLLLNCARERYSLEKKL